MPSNVVTVGKKNPEVIAVLNDVEMGEGYNEFAILQAVNAANSNDEQSHEIKKNLIKAATEFEKFSNRFDSLKKLKIIDKTVPMRDLVELAVKDGDWFKAVEECSKSLNEMFIEYNEQEYKGVTKEKREDSLKKNYNEFKELLEFERAIGLSNEEQKLIDQKIKQEQEEFQRALNLSNKEQGKIDKEEEDLQRVLALSLNQSDNRSPQAGPEELKEAGSQELKKTTVQDKKRINYEDAVELWKELRRLAPIEPPQTTHGARSGKLPALVPPKVKPTPTLEITEKPQPEENIMPINAQPPEVKVIALEEITPVQHQPVRDSEINVVVAGATRVTPQQMPLVITSPKSLIEKIEEEPQARKYSFY